MGTDATGKDNQKDYYLQNTLKINIKIPGVEGLTLTGSGTYDKYFKNRHYFKTPYMLYSWDGNEEHKLSAGQKSPATPELTEERTDQTFWMANAVANYNRTFGDHTIGVTVGLGAEKRDQNFVKAFRKYFLSSSKEDMDLGGVSEMTNSGNSWKEARLNYFGRVSYNIASLPTNDTDSSPEFQQLGVFPKKDGGKRMYVLSIISNYAVLSHKREMTLLLTQMVTWIAQYSI